ncbi:MAG: hypothetical protein WCS72_11740 [Deltaproteobacteria bacterium]
MGIGPVIHLGGSPLPRRAPPVTGHFAEAPGDEFYVIENAQGMRPFLVSVVSDSDHWLFVASNGGLTAGRKNPGLALFPYVTEDKLVDAAGVTGPVTSLLVTRGGRRSLWHPFRESDLLAYRVTRRLLKNVIGSRLVFEEENHDLGLAFRYEWTTSARHGFVRECALENRGRTAATVQVLDGLLNLLPANVDEALQQGYSCLLDAYKRAEVVPGSSLALFSLAAQPVDRAEPSESLRATTVWSHGLPSARVHLSAGRLATFDSGGTERPAADVRGGRGAYLLEARCTLRPGAARTWTMVADVDRTQRQVVELRSHLREPARLLADVRRDVVAGRDNLLAIVAATDGLQLTADRISSAHHLGNVLFNDLRGGVYVHGNDVPGPDFEAFVRRTNRATWERHRAFLAGLAPLVPGRELMARVTALGDPDLERHALEYLPLTFSRRHGDPSRPWNRFDIQVRDAEGNRVLYFEGNWRDIFQNWEALSLSHPEFVENVIAKFVNASTVDGHNPYRLTKDGIDWEVPDPGHPWSTIGYWGDHQIVYLLKLLELSLDHHPERLRGLLERDLFSYADVPYEIVPFAELVANPRSTIRFDAAKDGRIRERCGEIGSDGKLLLARGSVVHVGLVEKLLVAALAKLANFVPGGGIWLNTQRPEWNDANNALVGYGVSMVTLCYLQRFLSFLPRLLGPLSGRSVPVSTEVRDWMEGTSRALEAHRSLLDEKVVTDAVRGSLLRALGEVASTYRETVYRGGFSGRTPVAVDDLLAFAARSAAFLSHTIGLARRPDGLYHAYDVLVPGPDGAFGIEHLYEMLEGQVAVLSSGSLDPARSEAVLSALSRSRMYRADQDSYLLYPDRELPGFLEKNVIPARAVRGSPLLGRLLASGDATVVLRDVDGNFRFADGLTNGDRCREALLALRAGAMPEISEEEIARVLAIYEDVFHHRAFTGRSGTMFAYEGLGSIYWHMVGKLLVAAQECAIAADDAGAPAALRRRLADRYHAIRSGVAGLEKTPAVYGAFPLDPYSHTPAHAGAQQPGMTGEVKEEILTRVGELGARVREGRLQFRPLLLRRSEFLRSPAVFEPWDVDGKRVTVPLARGTLAFTYCQVPVVYHLSREPGIELTWADGTVTRVAGDTLDREASTSIFERSGRIRRVDVHTTPGR